MIWASPTSPTCKFPGPDGGLESPKGGGRGLCECGCWAMGASTLQPSTERRLADGRVVAAGQDWSSGGKPGSRDKRNPQGPELQPRTLPLAPEGAGCQPWAQDCVCIKGNPQALVLMGCLG